MATNYQRGARFEYAVRDHFSVLGWVVIRSAGSKGAADLCCLKKGEQPLLVQCKRRGRPSEEELAQLDETAALAGAQAIVALKHKRGFKLYELTEDLELRAKATNEA